MPIYISSKGEQKDTSTMAFPYLNSALRKAQEAGNLQNIQALEEELALRAAETQKTGIEGV